MQTLAYIACATVGAFIVLPLLAYFVAKFATAGKLQARELFRRNHQGDRNVQEERET